MNLDPNMLLLLAMGIVLFLFVIRPQMKAKKEMKKMLAALKKGDEVITNSGIHAKVTEVSDQGTVSLEIAKSTVITIAKEAIVRKK